MPISVACECGKRFAAKDEFAGKKIRCPACKAVVALPARKSAAAPSSPPANAVKNLIAVGCSCGKRFNAKRELAGKRIRCPACQSVVTVSANGKAPATTKPAAASAGKAAAVKTPAKPKPVAPSKTAPKPATAPSKAAAKLAAAPSKAAAPKKAAKSPVPSKPPAATKPQPAAKPAPTPKAKKEGGSSMLIIAGGGVALAAIIGAAAYFLFLSGPSTAILRGTITLNGQAVLLADVTFYLPDGKLRKATVSPEGRYQVKELPFTDVKATVTFEKTRTKEYNDRIKTAEMVASRTNQPRPRIKPANVPIPVEYASPEQTPLQVKVTEAVQTFNIEMQGKGAAGT